MSDPKYIREGDVHFALAHAAEECGELVAALGKTLRWGLQSYNPELPESERETNEAWVRREVADTQASLRRLIYELDREATHD